MQKQKQVVRIQNLYLKRWVQQSSVHQPNFIFPKSSFLTGFPEMLTQQPKKPQNFPIGNVFINEKTFKISIKK